jgi:hypothetical protein
MQFEEKIKNILEKLNQSGIAFDQQMSNNKNSYKFTPKDGKPSYRKYGLPTVYSAKIQGQPFTPNGISDEEQKKKKKLKKKKKSL